MHVIQLTRSKGPNRHPEWYESELVPRLIASNARSSRSRTNCDGFGIRGSVSGQSAVEGRWGSWQLDAYA